MPMETCIASPGEVGRPARTHVLVQLWPAALAVAADLVLDHLLQGADGRLRDLNARLIPRWEQHHGVARRRDLAALVLAIDLEVHFVAALFLDLVDDLALHERRIAHVV